MIVEALPVGTLVPGRFNHAGQVLGKKARPVASHGPPVWGLGDRLMSHLRKKTTSLLKPDTLSKIA